MLHILYNPISNNKRGLEGAKTLEAKIENETFDYVDVTGIEDIYEYISGTDINEKIVFTGGDGTINYFINQINQRPLNRDIYYYPAGCGNDFWKDISEKHDETLVVLNKYIENLPTVTINGKTSYFLNGVGYGIDGYCCEEGDRQKARSDKEVNYTSIAIKGILFKFKPQNSKITVDGVTHTFKHTVLAPVMNGRYYGGGMNVAPAQDRLNPDHTLSCVVMHDPIRIHALAIFPKIFEGKLVEKKKNVEVFTGKDFIVEFEKPCAAQIDGETVLNVTKIEVHAYKG